MSFLRHKQIYRPMDRRSGSGQAGAVATPPRSHRPMSLRPAIPRRVALLHCSPPLHQSFAMVQWVAGRRQPPLSRCWGIFGRQNAEFSSGVDTLTFFKSWTPPNSLQTSLSISDRKLEPMSIDSRLIATALSDTSARFPSPKALECTI